MTEMLEPATAFKPNAGRVRRLLNSDSKALHPYLRRFAVSAGGLRPNRPREALVDGVHHLVEQWRPYQDDVDTLPFRKQIRINTLCSVANAFHSYDGQFELERHCFFARWAAQPV